MARRKKFFGLFGSLGEHRAADAMGAIRAARKGNCKLASKRLYDASPSNQAHEGTPEFEQARESYRMASIIVSQHCSKDTGRGRKYGTGWSAKKSKSGKKYVIPGFEGANSQLWKVEVRTDTGRWVPHWTAETRKSAQKERRDVLAKNPHLTSRRVRVRKER